MSTAPYVPTTLWPFLQPLQPAETQQAGGLTLVGLTGPDAGGPAYLLAEQALALGLLTVTEVDQTGHVPELLAINNADRAVLLLDGEELVGAKQNRILNTAVLLGSASKTKIPVSCVEQGRWRHTSESFTSGHYSPAHLRARKSRSVTAGYRYEGKASSDQGDVWDMVAEQAQHLKAHSPTMAMHDLFEQQRQRFEEILAGFTCPPGARGVVAAVGAGLLAVDLFDRPATLEQVWPRLLMGYAMDVRMRPPAPPDKTFSTKQALAVLERAGRLTCEVQPSVGLGEDWRFESPDLLGHALVVEGACLTASIFPSDTAGDTRARPGMLPPSLRRRLRRPGMGM